MEKFIRQLPLVIAIILMISNCESANDSIDMNGDGSSGTGAFSGSGDGSDNTGDDSFGGSSGGGSGGGSTRGSASGSSDSSSSSLPSPSAQTPPVAACTSDPSDSVSVQMPQQVGGSWQMSNVSLSTLTKYQIYQRLSTYYQDSGKYTGAQSAQAMQMQMARMQQPGMLPGGMMGGMGQMGQMNQMPQMAQMAQMNQMQVQQYVQALMQQMQILQVQNQQLQMKAQAEEASTTMTGDYGDFGSSDTGEENDSSEKHEGKEPTPEEMRENLEAIANILGVPVTDDLASIIEERLGSEKPEKNSDEGVTEGEKWEEAYQELADLVPTEKGETPEQALRRLFPEQAKIHDVRSQSSKKGDSEMLEQEESSKDESYVFDPATAPPSLTSEEEKQLETWKEERATLMDMAGGSLSEALEKLTPPQEWALLKEAFARLHQHAKCQQHAEE